MPGNSVFRRVGGLHPGKSVFDLSYDKKFTCDMGQLIPVMCDEVVPGDVFQIGNEVVLRFQPLVAPVMHEVNVFCHYFFVPYRLLWDDWEDFITGGVDGNVNDGTSDQVVLPLPRAAGADNSLGTLWDYFGFPVGKNPPGDSSPLRFPWLAYNLVWNEYYRDETLQEELPNSADPLSDEYNQYVWYRNWEKDYFTSALPWQQRGVSPALPISGVSQAVFGDLPVPSGLQVYWSHLSTPARFLRADTPVKPDTVPVLTPDDISEYPTTVGLRSLFSTSFTNTLKAWANSNSVDLSNLATFDVADLRLAFQIQKWLERNARAGVRYTEFLRAHFGVSPRDERLQRPEYIGGSRSPVIVSEVLKTSTTDSTSAQGNMAGHGIAVNRGFAAKYRVHEYGLILGLMSVMPRSAYQQGIDRQWLRRTKYDFYFPEFANLSEQAIELGELYAGDTEAENMSVFGYQGRYDEMRVKRSMVCSNMRSLYSYWHLGRIFDNKPVLNEDFIICYPSKRIFAVQTEPGLIVNFGNLIRAVRPLPVMSDPGLVDHN